MGEVLTKSLRRAVERWPAVALLFVANILPGLAFMAVAWRWLAIGLDGSLATRTLLTDLDVNVFVDLFAHQQGSLFMLLASLVSIAAAFAVVWVWVNGTAVLAVTERQSLSICAAHSFALTPRFFLLWLMTLLLQVSTAVSVLALARAVARWTADSPNEATFYAIAAVGLVVAAAFAVFLSTVHDHARVYCAATRASAVESYGWSLRFVLRVERRAVPLAVLVLLAVAAAWVVYQCVAMVIPPDSMPGVVVALVWGELFVLQRLLGRLWAFSLATELQERFEAGSS